MDTEESSYYDGLIANADEEEPDAISELTPNVTFDPVLMKFVDLLMDRAKLYDGEPGVSSDQITTVILCMFPNEEFETVKLLTLNYRDARLLIKIGERLSRFIVTCN